VFAASRSAIIIWRSESQFSMATRRCRLVTYTALAMLATTVRWGRLAVAGTTTSPLFISTRSAAFIAAGKALLMGGEGGMVEAVCDRQSGLIGAHYSFCQT
jgi:hypothetical protein